MGKINWEEQTEPVDSPNSGKVYMYIDSADGLLTLKDELGNITKYSTTAGDVTAASNITDNAIVRGDGGAKGVQESGILIDDSDNITGVGYIKLTAMTAPAHSAGLLFYDTDEDELSFYNSESDVKLNIGTELWIKVRNNSGVTIDDFTPVFGTGAIGNRITIAKAQADAEATSDVIGITTHSIENNTDGFITSSGLVNNVDTDGSPFSEVWSNNDKIYLSPTTPGWMTNVKPTGNNIVKALGNVLVATNNGSFNVKIDGADTIGAASSTDNAIAKFDGTSGKRVQNSGILIDDSNNITGVTSLAVDTINEKTTDAGVTVDGVLIKDNEVDGVDVSAHDHSGAGQGGTVDHVNLSNKGTNTHAQIDTHIADATVHFTEASIDHTAIQNIGTNSHAQIDTHIASTSNPHSTDVGNIGSGTLAELNTAITDATLLDTGDIQYKTGSLHAASEHQNGGALEISIAGLSGEAADAQKVAVSKNSGATVGTRSTLNLIEGSNVTLTIADDAGGDEVDITIAASGGAQYPEYLINADMFQFPNNSDWTVNSNAQLATDSNNAALSVMKFDDTTEEGIGILAATPSGATNIIISLRSRAETSAASNLDVVPKLYVRELPDNAAVESWSAGTDMTTITMGTSNEYFQYDEQTIALSALGMVAGRMFQLELTRNTGSGSDTLSGDWTLLQVKIGFS